MRLLVVFCLALIAIVSADCPTGMTGADCDINIVPDDPSCTFVHDPLKTQDPPALRMDNDLTEFEPLTAHNGVDTIKFTVQSSHRYYQIRFNFSGEDPAYHELCSGLFTLVSNPLTPACTMFWTAEIAWANMYPHCGLTREETSDQVTFRGSVLVDEWENIDGDFRGRTLTRYVHSVLPFKISFPKHVDSSAQTIDVFAPLLNLAAVVRQATTRGTGDNDQATADVTLYTNVQYPFELINPAFVSTTRNDLGTPTIVNAVSGEPCTAAHPCEENFLIHITVPNDVTPRICDYTGNWTFSFLAVCQSDAAHCPLQINPNTNRGELAVTVSFHLTSENFCPQILADITASCVLTSYQDALDTIPKSDFLVNARTYWRADVSSPSATIVEVSTSKVSVGSTLLYSKDANFFKPGANFVPTDYPRVGGVSPHPTYSQFAFDLNPTIFTGIAPDGHQDFSITATLNVIFQNTDASSAPHVETITFRPSVMQGAETSSSSVGASHDINLSNPSSPISSDNTIAGLQKTTFIGIIAGCGALALILSAIIVFAVRRTKSAPTKTASLPMEGVRAQGTAETQL